MFSSCLTFPASGTPAMHAFCQPGQPPAPGLQSFGLGRARAAFSPRRVLAWTAQEQPAPGLAQLPWLLCWARAASWQQQVWLGQHAVEARHHWLSAAHDHHHMSTARSAGSANFTQAEQHCTSLAGGPLVDPVALPVDSAESSTAGDAIAAPPAPSLVAGRLWGGPPPVLLLLAASSL